MLFSAVSNNWTPINLCLNHYRPFQGNLPKSLLQISLNNVEIYNNPVIPLNTSSPFFKLQKFLPHLREVRMSFSTATLVLFSLTLSCPFLRQNN